MNHKIHSKTFKQRQLSACELIVVLICSETHLHKHKPHTCVHTHACMYKVYSIKCCYVYTMIQYYRPTAAHIEHLIQVDIIILCACWCMCVLVLIKLCFLSLYLIAIHVQRTESPWRSKSQNGEPTDGRGTIKYCAPALTFLLNFGLLVPRLLPLDLP